MKAGLLQLVPHEHSGKIRPHEHTSYPGLFFMMLVVGVLLLGSSWAALAATPAVNPQSGSVGLSGTVRGPAPSTAAVIVSPRNGSHTSSIPITVSGTCPVGTFVDIEKNLVFGGITNCTDGTFSLLVDLFDGSNDLVARVSDALGQFGPDSTAVTVFYDAPAGSASGGALGRQLFLETASTVLGIDPGQALQRTVTIVGGIGPYAISWDWGDSKTDLVSQATEGVVRTQHAYDQAGTYRVIVRVTDSQGNSALLQLLTVVNGPATGYGVTNGNGLGALPGVLYSAWPLFVLSLFMVIFFWMGERREVAKLRRQNLLLR